MINKLKNKIINLYNYIFYCIPYKIKDFRYEVKWAYQRVFRGFDDRAFWGLDSYLTEIILPVLKFLRKDGNGYPSKLTDEEWKDVLDKMIIGFQELHDEGYMEGEWETYTWDKNRLIAHQKKVNEGLKLFSRHFQNLWN
jgi:hypothetical protein